MWLPSFFSEAVNALVKDLVILSHVLDTNAATTHKYLQHLSLEQQELVHGVRSALGRALPFLEEGAAEMLGGGDGKDREPASCSHPRMGVRFIEEQREDGDDA